MAYKEGFAVSISCDYLGPKLWEEAVWLKDMNLSGPFVIVKKVESYGRYDCRVMV